MHPAEFSILLHRALEARIGRLLELTSLENWRLDPIGLHDVRVASRRVRSVLDLVDPTIYPKLHRHQRRLRALTRALGATREQDVHLERLGRLRSEDFPLEIQAALEHTLEQLDRARRKAQKRMLRNIAGLPIAKCADLLQVPSLPDPFAPGDVRAFARSCLEPRLQAALEALPYLIAQEDVTGMHELRIHVKKARYTLEILGPVVGEVEPALQRLRELQTILGEHHDLAALESLLWQLHGGLNERGRKVLAGGLLAFVGQVAEDRHASFDRFRYLAPTLTLESFVTALWPPSPSPGCTP